MSHGDQVTRCRPTFSRWPARLLARLRRSNTSGLPIYGLQFHPEVTHTPPGKAILGEFSDKSLRLPRHVETSRFRRADDSRVARAGRESRVICGLSGGVDSSVVAALLAKAIGPQLSCILVDNGLLRKDEEAAVIREFTTHFKTDLHVIKAEEQFLAALAGITDPQEKRRRIGHVFIECFKAEAAKVEERAFLGPRDAVSRRDRKRRGCRWAGGHDQAASQRGRVAGGIGF